MNRTKRLRLLSLGFLILSAISCSRDPQPSQNSSCGKNLVFDFTVETPSAKSSQKTSWTSGDKIVLFFNSDASKGYLTLAYDGTKWTATPSGDIEKAISEAGACGVFDAAYCADSDGSVTLVSDGQWMVGGEDSYFMSQSDGSYTLSGNKVTFTVKVALEYESFIQLFIPEASQGDLMHVHGSTRSEGKYTGGLKATSCAFYGTGAQAEFCIKARGVNDTFKGYSRDGGAAFYALNEGGSNENFTFCLHHDGKDFYYKVSGKTLSDKMSIRLPALSEADKWTEDQTRCVLYKDGHLVLNQYGSEDDVFKGYGEIDETFTVPSETVPWSSSMSKIKYVEVASPFKPAVMTSWFSGATALQEFHGFGIDCSEVTSMTSVFLNCGNMTICDVSSWSNMTKLTRLKGAFQNCSKLKGLDLSGWGVTDLATLQNAFYKCSALEGKVDLSGWEGSLSEAWALVNTFNGCSQLTEINTGNLAISSAVTSCQNCFYGCGSLQRIYAPESQDWKQETLTTSKDMFKNCYNLVGGNGSAWTTYSKDNTNVDNTYACIDKEGKTGYFTKVVSPETDNSCLAGESPAYWNPTYRETTAPTNADSALVAKVLSSVKVNMCVYSDDERQWVGYYDGDHRMNIAQRTLPTGPWKYVSLDEQNAWDSHNYITMHKDSKGVLRISGNMHATPLVFFQTDESGEISTLHRVKHLTGQYETQVTYPKFMNLKDGRLLFHYRIGSSGNGNEIYDVLNADDTWSLFLDTPLTDGEGQRNAYMLDPAMDSEGNYHLVWVWRETSDCSTNHDLSHAWSPDMKNWYAADGSAVALPITYVKDDKIIVDNSPVGGGMLNGGQKIGFDSQDRPLISYYKYDENGKSQFYLARYQDGQWKKTQLTNLDYRWEFSGGGSIVTKMNVGAPVQESTGEITVVCYVNDSPTLSYKREIWVDGTSLEVIKEASVRPGEARYPSWVGSIQTQGYSGTLVINKAYDLNSEPYMLRWESLANNNDKKPSVELPPPTELRVVKTYY